MPEERFEEKTEAATPRKIEETREKGNVARSMDLSSAVILLAAVLGLNFFGPHVMAGLMGSLQETLGGLAEVQADPTDTLALFSQALYVVFFSMLPILIILFVAALAINLMQVGFLLTGQPLTPNLEKLNPVSGLQRIFSLKGMMRAVQGILKISVVATVLYLTIWAERANLLTLMTRDFDEVVTYTMEIIFVVAIRASVALLVLAIFDWAYQRWQHAKDIRMSKQEIKEELKRHEGDPKIRERRRAIQRQLALQRMMAEVPRATVIVTNPTEISIALQYQQSEMEAPKVVAKGAGYLALRIREAALENDVPIVQRPEIARALYKTAEIGQTIPFELYQAVAEILALVYRIKGKAA